MIKVVIAEDQPIVAEGLRMLISKEPDMEVAGVANDGYEAHRLCKNHLPDVVLMDVRMPKLDGIEATRLIKRDLPSIGILIVTTFNEEENIYACIRNGANGYILKDANSDEIMDAIRRVHGGGVFIEAEVARKVVERLAWHERQGDRFKPAPQESNACSHLHLTERELEIMHLLGEGACNQDIAKNLHLSEGTVKNHISRLLDKMEMRDRTQLALHALKNNL